MKCVYCGGDVDPDPDRHYQRQSGWRRRRRGASSGHTFYQLTFRTTFNEYACLSCMALLRRGEHPMQRKMADAD